MADRKVVNEWLEKADEDLNFAVANLHNGSNFYSQICFHFHQAAEKYLKAFIVAYDLEFEKVHDLVRLQKICAQNEQTLSVINNECRFLNAAYIDTRYPVHWPTNYDKENALKAQEAAKKIGETIKALLKKI